MTGLAVVSVAGCTGPQSMLAPAGPGAHDAAAVWWPMLAGSVVVLVLVTSLWLIALRRRPRGDVARDDRGAMRWLIAGALLPSLAAVTLLAFGLPAGQRMFAPGAGAPLRIDVTGRQWHWEVRYPAQGVVVVDELHLPAGRPVEIRLSSADVIHSFWVPRLGRKLDVVPGRINVLRLQADAPGAMRGQCAEFCGRGHAGMILAVRVHGADEFDAWLARHARTP